MGWFFNVSVHNWRNGPWGGQEGSDDWAKPQFYIEMAQSLERACFDYMMFEDSSQITDTYGGSMDYVLKNAANAPQHDPMPFLSVLGPFTDHIGLIGTVSTSFYPPYLAARMMATIDHLTQGRSGVNLVTSSSHLAAQNYGLERHVEHDERYAIASEWTDVVEQLWDSWEPGAVLVDRERGVWADHTKVHTIDFEGRYFSSRGPLNTPPGPQGRPIICQAGGSEAGRDFGARYADTIIALVQGVDAMRAYRTDISKRAVEHGRNPEDIKVMFIVSPVLANTDAQAWAKRERQNAAQREHPEALMAMFSYFTGVDFSTFDLDAPLPADLTTNGHQSTLADLVEAGRGKTLRELAGSYKSVESVELIGSPATVAEKMGEVMAEVGGDGFLINGPINRRYIAEIADGLAPELMKRGLTRAEYTTDTLRETLLQF